MTTRSLKLSEILCQRINDCQGLMPFDVFMDSALYEPGLGYYEGPEVFGKAGDYVTAVSMGPWLALGIADLIKWGWSQMKEPGDWHLIEQGGGEGKLLVDVLAHLDGLNITMPSQIIAIERSDAMRERQKRTYKTAGLSGVMQITDLADIEKHDCCLFFCNELPDAFPVRCFSWKHRRMYERGVAWSGSRFVWRTADEPLADGPPVDDGLKQRWPDGYESEWSSGLERWQRELASVMDRGYVFCIDYGYCQSEFYMPERQHGTLMAHCKHKVQQDVLANPGDCDITAHVDFTAMVKAGSRYGFYPLHFMAQGAWLAQSPSVQRRMQEFAAEPGLHLNALTAAKRLMLPAGMGEVFKLCVQARHSDETGVGHLRNFDHVRALGISGRHE